MSRTRATAAVVYAPNVPLPSAFQPLPRPRRRERPRDRHGRGFRGPTTLPGPLSPLGTRLPASAAERFDDLVLTLVEPMRQRLGDDLADVEFGVEETPLLSPHWDPDEVPLATLVPATTARTARIVLFRRPLEHRVGSREELSGLVLAVLVEQVAELLGRDPVEVDPRYEG